MSIPMKCWLWWFDKCQIVVDFIDAHSLIALDDVSGFCAWSQEVRE